MVKLYVKVKSNSKDHHSIPQYDAKYKAIAHVSLWKTDLQKFYNHQTTINVDA